MKTKIHILFFVITLTSVSMSCNKCPKPADQRTTHVRSDFTQNVLPYYDNAIIKFLRNKIDTVTFFGGNIITGYTDGYTQDECPVLVHCQFMSQQFSDNQNNIINLKYSVSAPNEGEYSEYSVTFNQDYFGKYAAIDIASIDNHDSMYVLGKPYASPFKMVYNPDTIYFRNGIIKIKYQNTIYEKIP
ncbi:MAG: hypothetical protein WCO54_05705 [Bacteroidota bacterium]